MTFGLHKFIRSCFETDRADLAAGQELRLDFAYYGG